MFNDSSLLFPKQTINQTEACGLLVLSVVRQACEDTVALWKYETGQTNVKPPQYSYMEDAPRWLVNGGLTSALDIIGLAHLQSKILGELEKEMES